MKDAAIRKQIRRTYEVRPYPDVDDRVLRDTRRNFVPMEWIQALWKPGRQEFAPERILIAGCGTGREAFQMSRRFLEAQIVAVDFSPRSILIARELQQRAPAPQKIRFL